MTDTIPAQDESRAQPVLVMAAVLTTYMTLAGGLAATGYVSAQLAGLLLLIGTALTAGMAVYTRRQVMPWANVATFVNQTGDVVAGPSAPVPTGTKLGRSPVGPGKRNNQ